MHLFRRKPLLQDATLPQLNAAIDKRIRLMEDEQSPTAEDWYWGRGGGTEEDRYWRRLSDDSYEKDVLPSTYLELHNEAYTAWNENPIANYIIEIGVNFVLGDGIQVHARDQRTQKVIEDFWNDPDNRMDLRIYDLCQELSLYGEIFVRFFVNEYSGAVKIATMDPSTVDEIETDPENIEKELRVHRRPLGQTFAPGSPPPLQPLEPSSLPGYEGTWFTVPDEVMHFAINKVSNAKRGKSDLATLLPWLRRYQHWLQDRVRINKFKSAFLWDISVAGADARTIAAKQAQYSTPPNPGSVLFHSDTETWTAIQPRIDAGDVAEDGRAVKLMIAMGAGLPEHYLSSGEHSNRATASEMALPTVKKFKRRQEFFGHIIRAILNRVIAEKQARGLLPQGIDTGIDIIFPDIDVDDNAVLAQAGLNTAQALQIAKQNGWVSDETASRLFFQSMGEDINAPSEVSASHHEQPLNEAAPRTP